MSEKPLGTANILRQYSAHQELKQEYSPETANELAAKSLNRHGIEATSGDVASWDKINNAAVDGKIDIPAERQVAETLANGFAQATINIANQSSNIAAVQDANEDDMEIEDEDESEPPEDDLTTIDEMYGYDNPEDNDEAALDDVLKIQEQGG